MLVKVPGPLGQGSSLWILEMSAATGRVTKFSRVPGKELLSIADMRMRCRMRGSVLLRREPRLLQQIPGGGYLP